MHFKVNKRIYFNNFILGESLNYKNKTMINIIYTDAKTSE